MYVSNEEIRMYRNQQISLTDTIRETSVDTKLYFQRIFLNVH